MQFFPFLDSEDECRPILVNRSGVYRSSKLSKSRVFQKEVKQACRRQVFSQKVKQKQENYHIITKEGKKREKEKKIDHKIILIFCENGPAEGTAVTYLSIFVPRNVSLAKCEKVMQKVELFHFSDSVNTL